MLTQRLPCKVTAICVACFLQRTPTICVLVELVHSSFDRKKKRWKETKNHIQIINNTTPTCGL